ncbi:MAG: hypothetical protein ABI697_02310 [Devosia sp.]
MTELLRTLMALTTGAMLALTPLSAGAVDEVSLGIFQAEHGEQDYAVTLCGDDGKHLCVKLVALRKGSDTPRGREFLGVNIIDTIKPSGPNTWKGTVTYQGKSADGFVKVVPFTSFFMHGCAYIVLCLDITLDPKPGQKP